MDTKSLKKYKVLEGLIIAFIILFIFFTALMHQHKLPTKPIKYNHKYGRVLSSIEGIKEKNPRIVDLALLAAHDSNTYNMKYNAPMDEAENNTVIGKTANATKGFQYRFAVTQQSDLYNQFMQGVRVFHIKYTYYKGEWYGTHAKLTGKLSEYILNILKALDENPGEFVITLFHPLYFGNSSLGDFHNYLETIRYKGKNIYDYVQYNQANIFNEENKSGERIGTLRYNQVTENGTKAGVILMDRRESKLGLKYVTNNDKYADKYFDIDANTDHVWHSRGNSQKIANEIDKNMERIKNQQITNKLRINQTQLSFSVKDPISSIFKWSLYNMAKTNNTKIIENKNFNEWLKYMPIVKCDFVTSQYKDFNNKINQKLIEYNTNMIKQL